MEMTPEQRLYTSALQRRQPAAYMLPSPFVEAALERVVAYLAELDRIRPHSNPVQADAVHSINNFELRQSDLKALFAAATMEWGIVYEATQTENVITAAHSREHAEKWVAESPTDTGLVRRLVGPWTDDTGHIVKE